jgi:hypothetical protein
MTPAATNLRAQLCIALRLTSEVRAHLNSSHAWKQASVDPSTPIKKFRFQEEDYLGMPLEESQVDLTTLRAKSASFAALVQKLCPELPEKALDPQVLAQLLIS